MKLRNLYLGTHRLEETSTNQTKHWKEDRGAGLPQGGTPPRVGYVWAGEPDPHVCLGALPCSVSH